MDGVTVLGPISCALTMYFIHRLRLPVVRFGLVDIPGGRKAHDGEIPLVGGIAIFVAFAFGALLLEYSLHPYRPLFAGMGLLLLGGMLDDLHDLGVAEKMGMQVFAALLLVVWGGLEIAHLGTVPLIGPLELGWLAIPFTLLCVVGLINAINMIDGADGLAGGVLLTSLFWLVVVGAAEAGMAAVALPALLAFTVLGFLFFNFPHPLRPKSIAFMGDSGSTMLGFALAWFAIDLVYGRASSIPPVTVAWILAVPVFDTMALMTRRVLKGRSPMAADREHLHHIFERAGFSCAETTCVVVGVNLVLGGIGVAGWWLGVPEPVMWVLLLAWMAVHFAIVLYAWRAMRVLRHLHPGILED